jgi:hypothetical protein
LKIYSLAADQQEINGDTTTMNRTNAWIKDLSKDIYLREAVNTISLMNEEK